MELHSCPGKCYFKRHRIFLPTLGEIKAYFVDEIIFFEADNRRCKIFLSGAPVPEQINKTIGELAIDLTPINFCQWHRSSLVNREHVVDYLYGGGGNLKMTNGKLLSVARENAQGCKHWLLFIGLATQDDKKGRKEFHTRKTHFTTSEHPFTTCRLQTAPPSTHIRASFLQRTAICFQFSATVYQVTG